MPTYRRTRKRVMDERENKQHGTKEKDNMKRCRNTDTMESELDYLPRLFLSCLLELEPPGPAPGCVCVFCHHIQNHPGLSKYLQSA